jgi:hypothetical protein
MSKPICPFCGAYSPKQCDLEEETGGVCPWEESEDEMDDEPEDETLAEPTP